MRKINFAPNQQLPTGYQIHEHDSAYWIVYNNNPSTRDGPYSDRWWARRQALLVWESNSRQPANVHE